MKSSQKNVTLGAIFSFGDVITKIVANFVYVPILLNSIGKSEYGLYQIIASIIAYLSVMESSFSASTLKYYCKSKATDDKVEMENVLAISELVNLIISVAIIAICFIMALFVDDVYGSSMTSGEIAEARQMIIISGLMHAVNLLTYVYVAVISGNERFVFLKSLNIINNIASPICILVIVKRVPNALAVVYIQLVLAIIIAVVRKIYVNHVLGECMKLHHMDWFMVRTLLSYIGVVTLVSLADQIFWKADQLILGKIFNTAVVAVYAIGAQIFSIYMSIGTVISSLCFPRLISLIEKKCDDEVNSLFTKVGRITYIVCAAIFVGFVSYGREFIWFWAGEGYEDAYYIGIILMLPFTIDLIQSLGLSILQIKDKYMFRAIMYLIIAIINIVSTIFLAKLYGGIGAAISTAISLVIGTGFIMNIYYHKSVGIDILYFWKEIIKLIAVSVVILFFGLVINVVWPEYRIITLGIKVLLYAILYLGFMFLLGLNKSEKTFIYNNFKKIRRKLHEV